VSGGRWGGQGGRWEDAAVLAVGLTGGTGSGKTTVATQLAGLGAVVVDADRLAREVVAPGSAGLAAVLTAFGRDLLAADGSLDRARLGRMVFADPEARDRLNRLLHPRIRARTAELLAGLPADAVWVHDIPLLVENDLATDYHLVVVVDAPEQERVRRLVRDRGLAEAQAWERIRAQAGEVERRAVADVWLDTDGPVGETAERVRRLWRDRLVPFERGIRLGRAAPLSPSPELVPAPAGAAACAARAARRIAAALGAVAADVEHVGATALAGTRGLGVVDLVVQVSEEEITGPARRTLTTTGFPPLGQGTAVVSDEPGIRLHGSADPGNPVVVRLAPAGHPGRDSAVLLRDWLRAVPEARATLVEVKDRALGEVRSPGRTTGSRPAGYASAKAEWFSRSLPVARDWARRSGWTGPSGAGVGGAPCR
jgi:dephospho-CoA kinase